MVVRCRGSHVFFDNRFRDGGQVVSLMPAVLYPPRKIPGTPFCLRLSQPQGHNMAVRFR
jgi:hypothetical protein